VNMQDMLTIYLAGAITNIDQSEALGWRENFRKQYEDRFEIISPEDKWPRMEKYRGTEKWHQSIVAGERRDIQNSNAMIAKINPLSAGTSIGLVYAFLSGKTVVLYDENINDKDEIDKISPVVLFHKHAGFNNLEECVEYIENRHNRRSVKELITTTGTVEPWNESILLREIERTIKNLKERQVVYFDHLDDINPKKYLDAVIMQLEDELAEGKIKYEMVSSDHLRRITESIFMNNAYRDELDSLAKHYIRHRWSLRNKKDADEIRAESAENYRDFLHDIKGNIGNIRRRAQMLERSNLDDEKRNHISATIQKNVQAILDCAEDARRKIENPAGETLIPIRKVIHDWIETVKSAREEITVFCQDIPESMLVRMSKKMLEKWLQVLTDNAVAYGKIANSKMEISISVEWLSDSGTRLEFWNSGNHIEMSFAETIFEVDGLRSTNTEGWGVGLRGIYRDVRNLKGAISCTPCINDSNIEGRFDLFPREKGSPKFQIDLPDVASSAEKKQKILVADDDPNDRKEVVDCLQEYFEIIECSNIDEAVHITASTKDLYGAVLDLDFREKGNRDGVWLCKELLRENPELLIAMASGKTSWSSPGQHWMDRAKEVGARATFSKEDYTADDLVGVFR
jgi:nucleoside 2-deoxyribosyltransferase/CheY-like chemotaxis protein